MVYPVYLFLASIYIYIWSGLEGYPHTMYDSTSQFLY